MHESQYKESRQRQAGDGSLGQNYAFAARWPVVIQDQKFTAPDSGFIAPEKKQRVV